MFDTIYITKGTCRVFLKDVERLVILGVLEIENNLEWVAPSFAQPEPKSNRVHFLSDFRYLNKQLKRKTYPVPKINEMLLKLEGFQYAVLLVLNMLYYLKWLRKNVSNLCTIILLWWIYHYKQLPMWVMNSPDIFQQKMNDLFHGFEFIRVYIYDHLISTKGNWTDHVHKLKLNLNKLK